MTQRKAIHYLQNERGWEFCGGRSLLPQLCSQETDSQLQEISVSPSSSLLLSLISTLSSCAQIHSDPETMINADYNITYFLSEVLGWLSIVLEVFLIIQPVARIAFSMHEIKKTSRTLHTMYTIFISPIYLC